MADTTIGTSVAIATPDLEIIEGQITTTSNQVAAHFGKRHTNVLRAIANLLAELPPEHQRNFEPMLSSVEIGGGAIRKDPAYRITRDGFTLLAMGFTGKEAMQWKVAYLTAFNKMEQELLARTARPHNPALDYDRISPAQAQDLKELVHAVVDAKVQGFAETWARLHHKFRVNSYLELPATRFAEARDYLLAKLPEPIEPPASPINAADGPALAAARKIAMDYFRAFHAAAASGQPTPRMDDIPQDVLEGLVADALLRQKMLVSFDYDTGSMQTKLVPSDANVISLQKGDYNGLVHSMPMHRLPELAEALNKRVASHLGAFSQHLQSNRPALGAM